MTEVEIVDCQGVGCKGILRHTSPVAKAEIARRRGVDRTNLRRHITAIEPAAARTSRLDEHDAIQRVTEVEIAPTRGRPHKHSSSHHRRSTNVLTL